MDVIENRPTWFFTPLNAGRLWLYLAGMQMSDRNTYEGIKREIKKAIESIRAKSPEAAEYLDKNIVMDDVKMTFAYTGDNRISLEQLFQNPNA